MEPVVSYEHDDGAVRPTWWSMKLMVELWARLSSHIGLGQVRLTNVWDSRPLRRRAKEFVCHAVENFVRIRKIMISE